jgi:HD-GYP domain-containing protein (c-di-GMP phosphodiesterase class II)
MLVLLPPALVPVAVAVAITLGNVPDYVRGRTHPDRTMLVLGDSWHALVPAALVAVAAPTEPAWSAWPVYAAAVGSQFATDYVVTTLREWRALGVSPALQPRLLAWVYVVDALLSPLGLLAALGAGGEAWGVLLAMPVVGLLGVFARERTAGLKQALDLNRAYRGSALLMGEMLEADDPYTGGEHSKGVVALALEVGRRLGLGATEQRNLEFGALLHDIGKLKVPAEILNKPGTLTAE